MIYSDALIFSPPRGLADRILCAVAKIANTVLGNPQSATKKANFECMTKRHESLIAGICLSFSRCREDFEDLRQDVLLNMWRGFDHFKGESSDSTWIYRVTLNTCVSYQRRRRIRQDVSIEDVITELYENSSEEEPQRFSQMYQLIGQLKPLDKSVMLMWLDGKHYDEIADVVGVSRDSVAARLKRSRDKLKALYQNQNTPTR